jgi:hypothetical protein
MRLDLKNKKQPITKRPGGVAQGEALTSNPSTAKKKKKRTLGLPSQIYF